MLVYDVTSKPSFESLQVWAEEVKSTAPKDIILVVVGNKIDLIEECDTQTTNEVGYDQAKKYAMSNGALLKLVSAKNNKGIF